jgi:hypothetical protein
MGRRKRFLASNGPGAISEWLIEQLTEEAPANVGIGLCFFLEVQISCKDI